jgi:hypothetical protein
LIFIKKYDIIYIESKGKEMINMKAVRVKAKVATKPVIKDIAFWKRAANDLAARLIKAMDEANAARAEAANLNLELMERECRIDELVKRIKWLESQLPRKSTEIVS